MSKKRSDQFSIHAEPALGGGEAPTLDPSEAKVQRQEANQQNPSKTAEIDTLRDSVWSEPSATNDTTNPAFGEWLTAKKARVGFVALALVTIIAGLIGGPFAVIGALVKSLAGGLLAHGIVVIYACVFGPLIEEFLKQSGAVFLLERRPWWLKHGWQFPLIAAISALAFATIENLLYIHVHFPDMDMSPAELAAATQFRWRYCTLLHLGCSLVASVGMYKTWRQQVDDLAPARLSTGFPWMVSAVVLHGLYNFVATFFIHFDDQT